MLHAINIAPFFHQKCSVTFGCVKFPSWLSPPNLPLLRNATFKVIKAVIDLPNRTETGSGFSGLARSVCRIRIQFHET